MDLKLVPVTADNWREAAFLTTDETKTFPLDENGSPAMPFRCFSAAMTAAGIADFWWMEKKLLALCFTDWMRIPAIICCAGI